VTYQLAVNSGWCVVENTLPQHCCSYMYGYCGADGGSAGMVGRAAADRGRVEDVARVRIGVGVVEVGGGVDLVARRWPLIVDNAAAVGAAVRKRHSRDDVVGRVVVARTTVGVASRRDTEIRRTSGREEWIRLGATVPVVRTPKLVVVRRQKALTIARWCDADVALTVMGRDERIVDTGGLRRCRRSRPTSGSQQLAPT